jgi:drug/metabolite transporter (DMT)-like permease
MDLTNRPRKRPLIGISLFIASALFMALMGTTVKILSDHQTAEAIVFWRNFVGLAILLPWMLLKNPKTPLTKQLKTTTLKLHLTRGIASFLSVFLYFYSLRDLSLSSATLLFNTIPIFIPLVAFFWKRIVILKILWWGLGVSFVGIVFALDPGKDLIQSASLIALLSGALGAAAFVSLRLGHYTETQDRLMFYLFLICALSAVLFTLFSFKTSWTLTVKDLWLMCIVGIFGFLYQLTVTAGAKFVPVRLGSIFIYFSVIFAFAIDRWVWHTHISLSTYLGFILIVVGAALMVFLYPKEDIQIQK